MVEVFVLEAADSCEDENSSELNLPNSASDNKLLRDRFSILLVSADLLLEVVTISSTFSTTFSWLLVLLAIPIFGSSFFVTLIRPVTCFFTPTGTTLFPACFHVNKSIVFLFLNW